MENGIDNNLVSLLVRKEITRLYKGFLETIEDLKQENSMLIDKVARHCAPEFAEDINYFTEEKHNHLRKRVLDDGNQAIREIDNCLNLFDYNINKEKVQQAVQKKIVKKFVVNSVLEIKE